MNNGYKKLYTAASKLMEAVGVHGEVEINSMDDMSEQMMSALYEIDSGFPDNEKHGYVEVETKYLGDRNE